MKDPRFIGATILITELNANGAMGFIVNQLFERGLNELVEFSHCKPFLLHKGGPVDTEHLYFIHQQPMLISDSENISGELYNGGNFKEAIDALNAGLLTTDDFKIFVGYCGWDTGELEAEIAEGSWEIIDLPTNEIFQ